MALYKQDCRWSRWAGTLADVVQIIEFALCEIPGDPSVSLRAELKKGREIQLDAPAELSRFANLSASDIAQIRVRMVGTEETSVDLQLRVERLISPPLTLSVASANETTTHGLVSRLREQIDRNVPPGKLLRRVGVPLAISGMATLCSSLLVRAGLDVASDYGVESRAISPWWLIVPSIAVIVGGGIAALLPGLELLPPSGKIRIRRWGGYALVVIAIIGLGLGVIPLVTER
jgi:hypothetical protein